MPGIVGLITRRPRQQAAAELLRMTAALRHETFYVSGTWTDEAAGIYAGWVARKGSFADQMPLRNERGDTTLVFSGEDYPDPALIQRLKECGHAAQPQASSYLVHLYEEDRSFPACLNGAFHGLVVDQGRDLTTLFTDRYGLQRLYYYDSPEGFYFAAEAKAILAVRPELRSLDRRSLGEFISSGCVLEDRTLFRGIQVLPCAASWTFSHGVLKRKETYFQPRDWEQQAPLAADEYYRELREVLSRNLVRYFQGSERIGLALTGGFDTRVIMAMRHPAPGSLPCYTFGGMRHECYDVRVARQVAELCDQSHQVIAVKQDFLSRFPYYAERSAYLCEGALKVSHSPDLYFSERAREIAPAKVVGTWGSEILRQVTTFKPSAPPAGLFQPGLLAEIRRAEETYAHIRKRHPITFAAFAQPHLHHFAIMGLEQTQLTVRCPFLDNDFVRTVYRSPQQDTSADVRLRLIHDGSPALARIPSDRGVGGTSGGLVSKVARLWLGFTFKAEYAYDYGMPQWLARLNHAASPLRLENLFLGRHKFLHFRVWYRDALRDYVRQILLDPRTLSRPYLERRAVERMVQGHITGNRNYTTAIHQLLTLELVHRLFLDGAPTWG